MYEANLVLAVELDGSTKIRHLKAALTLFCELKGEGEDALQYMHPALIAKSDVSRDKVSQILNKKPK